MQIRSESFDHNATIPRRHTCEGEDVSPPLNWHDVPAGTQSLALIVDDPDAPDPAAPRMTWVHWVVYDLDPASPGLASGAAPPAGAREGLNDWGHVGYGGPCPPVGRHRYLHKLYALDCTLGDLGAISKQALESSMQGHVLAHATLIGTYAKSG